MNNIIITAEGAEKKIAWGFVISQTGQLDYSGKVDSRGGFHTTGSLPVIDGMKPDCNTFEERQSQACPAVVDSAKTEGWQRLESSAYFSPADFSWIRAELCSPIAVYISPDIAIDNADTFAFITHIGAVLLAIENGDTLLAAELFNRRKMVFEKFANLCRFIFEPIAPYALFAWVYGGFGNDADFLDAYKNGAVFDSSKSTAVFLYWAAKKLLEPIPVKESAEEMFIRFFGNEKRSKKKFTIGIVGTNRHRWLDSAEAFFVSLPSFAVESDFVNNTQNVKNARNELFSNLKVCVQAELYNPADCNAISVSAEDVESKIAGNGGMAKVGYIRATGAAILRKALPNKFAFTAELQRLNNYTHTPVVVRIEA